MAQATTTASALRKTMSNYQPKGIAYASSDARREVIAEALRDVRFAEFSLTLHNGLAHNIVLGGLEDRGNIYQDEFVALEDDAKSLQDFYIENITPSEIDSSEFDLELAAIDIQKKDDIISSGFLNVDEVSIPVGLMVEKHEIITLPDGSFTSTKMDPVISSYGSFNVFDPGVKYGATYIYRARIVYLTVYEATAVDPLGNEEDEVVFATSLVASQGLKAQMICLENIAPDPPRNLKFNYDFSDNTLDVFWEEPTNPQRDVMRYQIFRRDNISQPFTLLGELDFDNSDERVVPLEKAPHEKIIRVGGPRKWYKDSTFNRNREYIYALACVDARGLTSSYSEQIHVSFDRFKNKVITERVSPPKAPKPYPNMYLDKDLFVDAMKTSGAKRMRIFFDPEYYEVVTTSTEYEEVSVPGGHKEMTRVISKKVVNPLNLIGKNYKLHMINLDLQDGNVFNINIGDETFDITEVPMTSATIRTIF